jgi:hypothetical protein
MNQSYLVINTNLKIVENLVEWDGNPNTWNPPENCICQLESTTIAYIWDLPDGATDYILIPKEGQGGINFTWDSTTKAVTTNQPKPPLPPQTNGLQSV